MRKRRKRKARREEKNEAEEGKNKDQQHFARSKSFVFFPLFLHDDGLAVTTVKRDDDVEKESPLNNLVVEF